MPNASDYLETQVGTHLLRTGSWTKPSAIYVALYTVMPAEAGTGGTEVTGGDYARVEHGPSDATWAAPVDGDGKFSNIGTVQFPAPSASWGAAVGFGLLDASTAGNYLIGNSFASPVVISSGGPAPAFAEGELSVTVA
jgi:hypothetical protein